MTQQIDEAQASNKKGEICLYYHSIEAGAQRVSDRPRTAK